MACSNCSPNIDKIGADPANFQWCVVRGDTATLRVKFFENDEKTSYSTSGWTYIATVYNPVTKNIDTLNVAEGLGFVDIIASPEITKTWGSGYSSKTANLSFDLQITIPAEGDDVIWTPVIGSIAVLADVTPGGL
jgi:hypothetical protein